MIEKNHSQSNIYLHDLKLNSTLQQTTATKYKPNIFIWLCFLIVASVLLVAVNYTHNQKIDLKKIKISQSTDNPHAEGLINDDVRNETVTRTAGSHFLNLDGKDLAKLKQRIRRIKQIDTSLAAEQPTHHSITHQPITDARYYSTDLVSQTHDEPEVNWITVEIKKGDSLSKIFDRLGLPHRQAITLASASNMKSLNYLTVGQKLKIRTDENNVFTGLNYKINHLKTIEINKDNSGEFVSTIEELEPQTRIRDVTAPIEGNLFSTADNLSIPNRIISKLSSIFRWDIDFARDINQGDRFSLIFEEKFVDNEFIATGDILAAEFIINGNITRAILHKDEKGNSHYYTPEGKSLRKAFMRNPMKFAKVTSGFTKGRYHPILKKWRAHKGVDYGAPTGTPIMATADGVIDHLGRKGAYGKAIVIRHGKSYSTLYGHMKGFRKGLNKNEKVKQGQIIGYVGSTGLATGPHLHYEFRIDGKHVDPLAIELPKLLPIDSEELNEFIAAAEKWIRRLDALQGQSLVSVENYSQPSI